VSVSATGVGRVGAVLEQCWHRVPGGTAGAAVASLGALAQRGDWEIVAVSAWHRHPSKHAELADAPFELAHLRWPRLALYEAWQRLRWPALPSMRCHTGRLGHLDIVHATGGVVPPPGDAALVVTINDLAFLRYPNYFHKRGVAFMTRAFDLAKVHADLVLVPSTYTLEDCVERGLEAERIRVLPLGVTARAVSEQDRAEVRVRYRLPEQFLLWVGTSEPRKNLRALLAALTQSANDLPLLLVGPKGWRTDTDELLADKANVRHLGEVPKADLGVLYDLADVFVYPSLMEGFGLPVLEAMAQRTAVVTSAGTATAEVAGAGAWLVDPNDVASIAAGIDAVVGDSDLRKRLAHAGVQRAAAMSWGSVAEGLAAAYRLVM